MSENHKNMEMLNSYALRLADFMGERGIQWEVDLKDDVKILPFSIAGQFNAMLFVYYLKHNEKYSPYCTIEVALLRSLPMCEPEELAKYYRKILEISNACCNHMTLCYAPDASTLILRQRFELSAMNMGWIKEQIDHMVDIAHYVYKEIKELFPDLEPFEADLKSEQRALA